MRNLYFLLSLLSLLIISCSDEDTPQGSLITKMKFIGSDFNDSYENHEFNLEYTEGNKLVRIIDFESDKKEFHYTGDLITKIDIWLFFNNSDLNFERSIYLEYDNEDRLINIKVDISGDGTIQYIISFNYIDGNNANYTYTDTFDVIGYGTITFDDEDVIERFDNSFFLGQIYQKETTYNYDEKKHPYSGIRGFKELKLFNSFFGSIYHFGHNLNDDYGFAPNWGTTKNVKSITTRTGVNLENIDMGNLFSYEYGNNDFPTKSNKIGGGSNCQIICTYQ